MYWRRVTWVFCGIKANQDFLSSPLALSESKSPQFAILVECLCVCASVRAYACTCIRQSDLVLAATSQIIVVFSYKLVEMFTMLSRRVVYETHDPMSKVKVKIWGQRSKLSYLVRAITSQVIRVSSWILVEMLYLHDTWYKCSLWYVGVSSKRHMPLC